MDPGSPLRCGRDDPRFYKTQYALACGGRAHGLAPDQAHRHDPVDPRLDRLVGMMVDTGIRYEDAQREFEKRFIARIVQDSDGNLVKAAKRLGVHRNTLTRKLKELKIKARPSAS